MSEKVTNPLASGWGTTEFRTMVGTIASQLFVTIATLYVISPAMGLSPQEKIAAVGVLFSFITGSTVVGRSTILSRTDVKTTAIENPEATLKLMQASTTTPTTAPGLSSFPPSR